MSRASTYRHDVHTWADSMARSTGTRPSKVVIMGRSFPITRLGLWRAWRHQCWWRARQLGKQPASRLERAMWSTAIGVLTIWGATLAAWWLR